MKKQLFLFLLSFLAVATTFAQGREGARAELLNGAAMIERMAERLDLSEEQTTRLSDYRATYVDEFRAAMNEAETREEKQTISQEFRAAWQAELTAVLNDEQLALYEKERAEMRERRTERPERLRERRREHRENFQAHIQALARELELSDEQISSLHAFTDTQKAALEADLEAAESREDKEAVRIDYAQKFEQELQQTLSPEQFEQFQSLKAERLERREGRQGRLRPDRG